MAYHIVRFAPFLPLLLVLIGLAMAFGLIPPNGVYGIRTAETLASEATWYSANAAAGQVAVYLGLAATVLNLSVRGSATVPLRLKLSLPFLTTIAVALSMIAAGLAYT